MKKITVRELLDQHKISWYDLFRRGGGSKSMCFDWVTGRHLPSTRSAARIARAMGLPAVYVLDRLQTRNQWENSPRAEWGSRVRKTLLDASTSDEITGRIESGEPRCPSCGHPVPKAA